LAKARLALGKISGKDFIDYEVSYRRKAMRVEMLAGEIQENVPKGLDLAPELFFNRNQGKIAVAMPVLEQTQKQLHAKRSSLLGSLARQMASYKDDINNLDKYHKEILPLAGRVY
jgi:hypothetical protein